MKPVLAYFSLFLSSATLVCCALPALLVVLGAGASLAGLIGVFPQLVWFSEYKGIVFISAGILLAAGGYLQVRARNMSCPIDPVEAEACRSARGLSFWIYILSLLIYLVGAFFAFAAVYVF